LYGQIQVQSEQGTFTERTLPRAAARVSAVNTWVAVLAVIEVWVEVRAIGVLLWGW
jgi:hypothetical protein